MQFYIKFIRNVNAHYKLLLIGFIMMSLSLNSCKKFIGINPPINELVTSTTFASNSTATAAQLGIYTSMFNNSDSYNIDMNTGSLSDELTNYSTVSIIAQFYANSMTAVAGPGEWNNAYNYIYQANQIIEGTTNNSKLTSAVSQQLNGESKFIRAFWLFYLTNEYGDVPIPLSTNYTTNATLARIPQSQVYQQIIQDLKDAENQLNDKYVDGTSVATSSDRVRPNKSTAAALLARAYLYYGNLNGDPSNYTAAENEASSVINNSLYSLVPDLNGVFLVDNTEAIWQLQTPLPNSINTPEGTNFILEDSPSLGSTNNSTISPQLLSAFEPGDQRRTKWIQDTLISGVIYSYPFKYKILNGTPGTEYSTLLRLGEQYLIRAEAESELGNQSSAVNDLNTIRNRAGLENYSGAISQVSVLASILHERQVELFTEGHRWFDLKRTKNIDPIMSIVTPIKGGTWSSFKQLYPIPLAEIKKDTHLTQNTGY
jgi:hypothetical protein